MNRMIKCPACGAENAMGSWFCKSCGALFDNVAPESEVVQSMNEPTPILPSPPPESTDPVSAPALKSASPAQIDNQTTNHFVQQVQETPISSEEIKPPSQTGFIGNDYMANNYQGFSSVVAESTSLKTASSGTNFSMKKIFIIVAVVVAVIVVIAVISANIQQAQNNAFNKNNNQNSYVNGNSADNSASTADNGNNVANADTNANGSAGTKPSETESTQPPVFTQFTASSERAPMGSNTYTVANIHDGDIRTAWCEGVPGPGIGEWVQYSADQAQTVKGFRIFNGYGKTKDLYYGNNQVKKMTVTGDNGFSQDFTFKQDDGDFQEVVFTPPIKTTYLRFQIDDVYLGSASGLPGADDEDTLISEIQVL